MFGMPQIPYGLLGVAGGSDTRPTNSPEDMASLQKLLAAVKAQNATPNGRVARGFNQFGPQGGAASAAQASQPAAPMLPTPPTPAPVDMGATAPPTHPALSAQAMAPPAAPPSAPAGPTSVGGAPLNSQGPFAGPNSVGGAPLSGTADQWASLGPQQAQASGPDVIQKLMSYFKNKDNPTS
jgi:hypothetical protein